MNIAQPQGGGGAAGGDEIVHVAIFRFAKAHIADVVKAFRARASASRGESGNLAYDIYRGGDDIQAFCVVEHWASPAAVAAHERTETFMRFGRGVLARSATLRDTVTARAVDAGQVVPRPALGPGSRRCGGRRPAKRTS